MRHEQIYGLHNRMLTETLQLISDAPRNTFAFVHFMVAHYPFVFNEDGSYYAAYEKEDYRRTKDYQRQLKYMDMVIGQIVHQLRAANTFDDAMLIICSDHSWHGEPDKELEREPDYRRRVPLIIKLPGQESPYVFEEPIVLNQLKPLIVEILNGNTSSEDALRILKRIVRNS